MTSQNICHPPLNFAWQNNDTNVKTMSFSHTLHQIPISYFLMQLTGWDLSVMGSRHHSTIHENTIPLWLIYNEYSPILNVPIMPDNGFWGLVTKLKYQTCYSGLNMLILHIIIEQWIWKWRIMILWWFSCSQLYLKKWKNINLIFHVLSWKNGCPRSWAFCYNTFNSHVHMSIAKW